MHRNLILLSTLLTTVVATGCKSTPATPANTPSAAVNADTWAVVNGHQITKDEVEKAYRRSGQGSQPRPDEEALAAKLTLLNEMIIQDILITKARDLKIAVTDAELDAAYTQAKQNMPDDAFQKELSQRNLTPADMREGLKREILLNKVVEQEVGSKVAVSDQEVTTFFEANRAQFNVAEEGYRIAQIVITPTAENQIANRTGDDATTPQTAAAKAQMLMTRLKEGASFGDLAMDYSEDPESAPRGGDLGLLPMSRLRQAPPALRDAVLKGTPGTAKVVSAGGGYTIVLVISHEPAGQRDLTTPGVKDGISQTLRTRKEQLLRAAYLTAAQADADVTNYLARRIVESKGKI